MNIIKGPCHRSGNHRQPLGGSSPSPWLQVRELLLQNHLDEISRNVTVSEPAEGRRKITADLGTATWSCKFNHCPQKLVSKCRLQQRWLLLRRGKIPNNLALMWVFQCYVAVKVLYYSVDNHHLGLRIRLIVDLAQVIIECSGFPPALQQVTPLQFYNFHLISTIWCFRPYKSYIF